MTVRFLLLLSALFATAAQQTQAPPTSGRARKQQDSRLRKELAGPYTRWLDQDVAWIITPDERGAFLKLQTDDERARVECEIGETEPGAYTLRLKITTPTKTATAATTFTIVN